MRTWVVVVAALACGCGSKKQEDKPAPATAAPPVAKDDPPPPPNVFKGKHRLVNLTDAPVEVWVRRGFSYGPVKLTGTIAPWSASEWFAIPEHMSPVVLPAGSKPDAPEVSPMARAADDEVLTGVLVRSGGALSVTSLYDVSKTMTPVAKPPPAGRGAVTLWAGQLWEFADALTPTFGGRSFNVGDNTGACLPQRDSKMAKFALGGTATYEVDLAPGKQTISLHRWPTPRIEDTCKDAAFTFGLVVNPDSAQWAFVYTPDNGTSLATLVLPVGTP